jgi:hypothetical protein
MSSKARRLVCRSVKAVVRVWWMAWMCGRGRWVVDIGAVMVDEEGVVKKVLGRGRGEVQGEEEGCWGRSSMVHVGGRRVEGGVCMVNGGNGGNGRWFRSAGR